MRFDSVEALFGHAVDLEELVGGDEAAETVAIFDDAGGEDRTDATKVLESGSIGGVDVDDESVVGVNRGSSLPPFRFQGSERVTMVISFFYIIVPMSRVFEADLLSVA